MLAAARELDINGDGQLRKSTCSCRSCRSCRHRPAKTKAPRARGARSLERTYSPIHAVYSPIHAVRPAGAHQARTETVDASTRSSASPLGCTLRRRFRSGHWTASLLPTILRNHSSGAYPIPSCPPALPNSLLHSLQLPPLANALTPPSQAAAFSLGQVWSTATCCAVVASINGCNSDSIAVDKLAAWFSAAEKNGELAQLRRAQKAPA